MLEAFLKRNIWWLMLIVIGLGYYYFSYQKPCQSPIEYRIGSFDTRFGINQKDFLDDMNLATQIWGSSIGKNLFKYNPKGKLVVNLIYDDRQKTTQQNALLTADIANTKNLANSVKQQYLSLQSQYEALEQQYKDEIAKFEQDRNSYTTQVDYWNNNGGAPKNEYEKLTLLKNSLIAEQTALENKRIELNSLVDQINSFIHEHNLLVDNVNADVRVINRTAGQEFDEGVYDSGKNEIDIYEFSSNQKLVRVLAHELGHALGLPHNSNPKSIMYASNISDNENLSKEDLQALKEMCNL